MNEARLEWSKTPRHDDTDRGKRASLPSVGALSPQSSGTRPLLLPYLLCRGRATAPPLHRGPKQLAFLLFVCWGYVILLSAWCF